MKKALSLALAFLIILACFSGCIGKKTTVKLYFKDASLNKLNEETRKMKTDEKTKVEDILRFAVSHLIKGPENEKNKRIFPEETKLLSVNINGGVATLDFSAYYNELKGVDALLLRTSIVNTVCSIKGIDGVVINVEGKPIVSETSGKEFGVLSLENIAFDTNYVQNAEKTKIVLYFPQKNGDKLIRETRRVELQNALSLEKAVINELIKGPEKSQSTSALPQETKLLSIETKNDVCFVNFSSEFISKTGSGSLNTTLALYSVVNSLCELENVKSVQILINGENGVEFGNFVLDIPYEKNSNIVK